MNSDLITAFITFAFVSSVTPGPNNLMLLASATNFGALRTVPHMLGIGLGFTLMVILVGVGLMQIFDAWIYSYQILRVLSVSYLLFLAWKIAHSGPASSSGVDESNTGKPLTFIQAALFQWVNPKAWAMALTAISAYTPADHPLASVFIVALIFGLVNIPSISLWVLIGTQMRRFLTNPRRLKVFNYSMAILLVGSLYPVVFG